MAENLFTLRDGRGVPHQWEEADLRFATSGNARLLDDIATLRTLSITDRDTALAYHVKCHTSPGDGGGGTFLWNSTSTVADDNGFHVLPAGHTGPGRWVRYDSSGALNVRWFGAQGTGLVDDQPSIQAAFDAITTTRRGTIYLPLGVYRIDSGLSWYAQEFILIGDGSGEDNGTVSAPESDVALISGSTILKNFNGDALTLRAGNAILLVENLKVDVSSAAYATDTGHGIVANSGRIEIRNCKSNHHGGCGYFYTDSVSGSCNYWKVTNSHASFNRDSGLKVTGPNNNTNAGVVLGFHTRNNNWGIWIDQASNNKFFGIGLQSDILGGVYIEGDAAVKSSGNVLCYSYIEPQTTSHVVIADANCNKNIIIGGQGNSIIGHNITDNGTNTFIIGAEDSMPWINDLQIEDLQVVDRNYTARLSLDHTADRYFEQRIDGTSSGLSTLEFKHNTDDPTLLKLLVGGFMEILGAYVLAPEAQIYDGVSSGRLVITHAGARDYRLVASNSGAPHTITIETQLADPTILDVIINGSLTVGGAQPFSAAILNGVTGSRPGSPSTGQLYFDTTIGKPIWYDGTNWVDATGTTA
jgi:hypothetical protein